MIDVLQIFFSDSFWAASLRIASPLIFGVLGALLCERAGVLNLGIEGIFVVGAMTGWMTVWLGAPLPVGVLAAALAGALFGLFHAVLTVPLGLSQHVSGLGITLFTSSLASFAYRTALPQVSSPPRIEPFRPLDLPLLSDLPFLGPVLFQQTALTWLALLMVAGRLVDHGTHPARRGAQGGRRQPGCRQRAGAIGHPAAHGRSHRRIVTDGTGRCVPYHVRF